MTDMKYESNERSDEDPRELQGNSPTILSQQDLIQAVLVCLMCQSNYHDKKENQGLQISGLMLLFKPLSCTKTVREILIL